MDLKIVCYILGRLVIAETIIMLIPFFMALYNGEASIQGFAVALGLCASVGMVLLSNGRVRVEHLTMREGIAITGIGWIMATSLGMLPFVCGGYLGVLDAWFESISGFTGTGATVMENLSVIPPSILFWRMMTHWFGGLGIIVIFIALLPQTGQSTVYMYNAETTGPTRERVLPRLRDMTKALFQMYMMFTVIAMVVYCFCGLSLYDAVTHAMSTIGTGGFSTYDDNAMHFDNIPLEAWMTFFMILAGGNFGLYYRVWRKGPGVIRHNSEFKAYIGIEIAAMLLITANLVCSMDVNPFEAFRYASFQVGSISTTGFVSADFDQWPGFSKGILLLLMICGGCAGSTAGGMKVSRMVLLVKNAWAVVHQKLSPRRVVEVHMNGSKVDEETLLRVGQFFFLYILFIVFWALLLTADGLPVFDSLGISITVMGSVGPAFGVAGATCTYAGLSVFAKSILCVAMLLGRLEMFTLLIMLSPDFWQKGNRW
ncbi:trk system potassium uptake protein TrkH [Selenomonas sp. WCT3]|uniref:TrkH family potassium uptake protein n=1 Tax=Selenomonas sp. WCT3 TaxID=3158785 RepID=UPI0008810DB1|nr:trk system potassium uptake protein TrkH [Selenomonas ruminantium]